MARGVRSPVLLLIAVAPRRDLASRPALLEAFEQSLRLRRRQAPLGARARRRVAGGAARGVPPLVAVLGLLVVRARLLLISFTVAGGARLRLLVTVSTAALGLFLLRVVALPGGLFLVLATGLRLLGVVGALLLLLLLLLFLLPLERRSRQLEIELGVLIRGVEIETAVVALDRLLELPLPIGDVAEVVNLVRA
jgi:hypothetical protein